MVFLVRCVALAWLVCLMGFVGEVDFGVMKVSILLTSECGFVGLRQTGTLGRLNGSVV